MTEEKITGYRLFYPAMTVRNKVHPESMATGLFKTKDSFDKWFAKFGESRLKTLRSLYGDSYNFILKVSLSTGHNTPINNSI